MTRMLISDMQERTFGVKIRGASDREKKVLWINYYGFNTIIKLIKNQYDLYKVNLIRPNDPNSEILYKLYKNLEVFQNWKTKRELSNDEKVFFYEMYEKFYFETIKRHNANYSFIHDIVETEIGDLVLLEGLPDPLIDDYNVSRGSKYANTDENKQKYIFEPKQKEEENKRAQQQNALASIIREYTIELNQLKNDDNDSLKEYYSDIDKIIANFVENSLQIYDNSITTKNRVSSTVPPGLLVRTNFLEGQKQITGIKNKAKYDARILEIAEKSSKEKEEKDRAQKILEEEIRLRAEAEKEAIARDKIRNLSSTVDFIKTKTTQNNDLI